MNIYDLGFDKTLKRGETQEPSRTEASDLAFGALTTGSRTNTFGSDPKDGIWLGGEKFSDGPFRVTQQGVLYASAANITGTINASVGTIGGWTVNSTSIYTGTEDHSGYTTNAGDITIYSDGSDASLHAKNWYIDTSGNFNTTAGVMSGVSIASIPNDTSTDISLLEKTWTMVFSVTDADTIAWTAGTVTLSNGRTFSIDAGNTGNMAALTYIYIDPAVSSTVMQVTTTAATAMGANKILIGTAVNNTVTASFIPYGPGKPLVDGANIGAASIIASNIAANTITGNNILTMNISGKNATFDTGTIGGFSMSATELTATNFKVVSGVANTARVEVGTGSNIAGINSANAGTDIAFWAGSTFANRATAPFRVNAQGDVTMTSATISGVPVTTQGYFGGDGSDGALSITSGTTNIDLGNVAVVTKNYTSISITGTGALTFSNPHASGTYIILKSQGAVTITSSAARAIDVRGMGAAGGAAASNGTNAQGILDGNTTHAGTADGSPNDFAAVNNNGVQLTLLPFYTTSAIQLARKCIMFVPGSGGAGGINGLNGSAGAGGAGGAGGGALYIECNGALNITGTIDASGNVGSNGGDQGAAGGSAGGGGGGGAGGCILILYKTLTADSGTYTKNGGNGGNGGDATGTINRFGGEGGGGAGGYDGDGGDGGAGGGNGTNTAAAGSDGTGTLKGTGGTTPGGANEADGGGGGGGAGGFSLVAQNKVFA